MPKITGLSGYAKRLGFRLGDEVVRMGGYKVVDELDYLFYDNESEFSVDLVRKGKPKTVKVRKDRPLGLEFDWVMKPAVCKNHCIFCFVDQLPKGMRDSLYIKDDDYRFSFISGSYVTMTNVTDEDIDRIIRLRLSPLYISVHAWDDEVRKFMVKNPNTLKLREYMKKLGENGISMHTQLVVV
ncbi:MAG: radical SAM protein, partial [Clostridia bacterium]|nr:radical SAM protein [Clostridia bacterium]